MSSTEYNRQYFQENKSRIMARRRARATEIASYMKSYRKQNREQLNQHNQDWLDGHPGKRTEYKRRWRLRYPDKQRTAALRYVSRRRTRKLDAFVEDVDPKVLLQKFNGRCGICGRPIAKGKRFHIDHIVPLAKGGEHSYANTQPAHASCNIAKGVDLNG